MVLILLACAGACVVPFLDPPAINTSFDTLTVQGQPINKAVEASGMLTSGSSSFWSLSSSSSPAGTDSAPKTSAVVAGPPPARRRLQQQNSSEPFRNFIKYTLHVIYHNADLTTMLTPEAITKIRKVEEDIFVLPEYTSLCMHQQRADAGRECRRPVSITNFIYGSAEADGSFHADGSSVTQLNPVKVAQVCQSWN
jgi:hypothetical protein